MSKIAILIHMWYVDQYPLFAKRLEKFELDFDLYINFPKEEGLDTIPPTKIPDFSKKDECLSALETIAEKTYTFNENNVGQDGYGTLKMMESIIENGPVYDFIIKLQSLKNENLLERNLDSLLLNSKDIHNHFLQSDNVGMIGYTGSIHRGWREQYMNELKGKYELRHLSRKFHQAAMFWARSEDIFHHIKKYGVEYDKFIHAYLNTRTYAHSFERIWWSFMIDLDREVFNVDLKFESLI